MYVNNIALPLPLLLSYLQAFPHGKPSQAKPSQATYALRHLQAFSHGKLSQAKPSQANDTRSLIVSPFNFPQGKQA